MCSILAILGIQKGDPVLRSHALELSKLQRHRGPDWSGIYSDDHAILAHERLSIVDLLHGAQPLISSDRRYVLAVNGEIYNHLELRKQFPEYSFQTDSDCEVIIPLLDRFGVDGIKQLNGIFAFVLWDALGHRPLQGVESPDACRFESSRYWRDRAFPEGLGFQHLRPACASRSCGEACGDAPARFRPCERAF